MSLLSKIPEPLIALVTTALEPLAAKVWHVLTDHAAPASLKDAAKRAAEELAAQVASLAQATLDPAHLKTMLARVTEQMGALDPLFNLAKVIDEQNDVRRELEAKVDDLERQVEHYQALASGGVA